MKNTSERRQMILEYLLEHRETTRFELSNHFNVSLRTIERDILILSSTKHTSLRRLLGARHTASVWKCQDVSD